MVDLISHGRAGLTIKLGPSPAIHVCHAQAVQRRMRATSVPD